MKNVIKDPFTKMFRSQKDKGHLLFWPDLATCYYQKDVIAFLRQKKIDFVPKVDNPTDEPQCRLIEKFWALCKFESNETAKNLTQQTTFKRKWARISKHGFFLEFQTMCPQISTK